jgi:Sugar-transfer associated ATP-grasp
MIAALKSWIDSNEFAWMPPRLWRGTPGEHLVWRLRILARRHLRAQLIARQGLARTVVQNLLWPVLAPLKALLHVRAHPDAARGALARLRWWFDICLLQLLYNIRIGDQIDFRLDLPAHRPLARGITVCREQQALLGAARRLAREDNQIDLKLPFARFCRAAGLPHPEIVCHGEGPHVASEPHPWPARDLFFKPSEMSKGCGAEALRHDPAGGCWLARQGEKITPATVGAFAASRLGPREPWLLQPRLANGPATAAFGTGALNTCRIVTGRLGPAGADPVLLGAFFRFAVTDAEVDNLSAGGVGLGIDIATGRFSAGLRWGDLNPPLTHHPLTGAPLAGEILAGWPEMAALALRAHRAAGRWCSVGWDIAPCPEGPVLIEANLSWAAAPSIAAKRSRLPELYQQIFGPRFENFPA